MSSPRTSLAIGCAIASLALVACPTSPDAPSDDAPETQDMSSVEDLVDMRDASPPDMQVAPDASPDVIAPDMRSPTDPDMRVAEPEEDMQSAGSPCDSEGASTRDAPLIISGSVTASTCAEDRDWFGVELGAGCRGTVTVTPSRGASVTAAAWREDGALIYEPGEASGDPRSLSITLGDAAETVLIGVSASGDGAEATYQLDVMEECLSAPLDCSVSDDLYEDNDDHSGGDNPAQIASGDRLTASMCAAGADPFARYDYYTIEDNERWRGCILASKLDWPVTPRDDTRTNNRNWYRNNESLGLEHALGEDRAGGGPYQEVLRATWKLGDVDPERAADFETPMLMIPELDPFAYIDPNLDFDPPASAWNYQRATAWLYPVDYHVRVSNESYSQDGTAVIDAYNLDVRTLCDFSCEPRQGDAFFGIPAGDDWFDAYRGLRGGLDPDVALEQGGRLGGLARGIACDASPYNGYVDTDDAFVTFPRDIDVVNATAFGKGYVDGRLSNNRECTATLRVSWEGDTAPLIAWSTGIVGDDQRVWTYDARVSTTNDQDNPFFAHSSPAAAFSSAGWRDAPPEAFEFTSAATHVELAATPDLFLGPTQSGVVQVAIANAGGAAGTPWSVEYYCAEDRGPRP